jgi:hypothetical protein
MGEERALPISPWAKKGERNDDGVVFFQLLEFES